MVCVVMGEADGINRLKGPAFFLDGNLEPMAWLQEYQSRLCELLCLPVPNKMK